MSEERAQYGGRIDAGNIPITRVDTTEIQAIEPSVVDGSRIVGSDLPAELRDLRAENERLRKALQRMVEYRERWDLEEGHHDWCNALLDDDDCDCGIDAARAALNHAAPAAQQEGE